jgi:hypothetical protein
MKDPVRTKYGHHFERQEIIKWIETYKSCPLTRQPLTKSDLKEDPEFAREVLRYLK